MAEFLNRLLSRHQIIETGCWVWQGGTSRGGGREVEYGCVRWRRRAYRTHRLMKMLAEVDGLQLLEDASRLAGVEASHLCGNSLCGNPEHLIWESHEANARRRGR